MAISCALAQKSASIKGREQWAYKIVGEALEVIPRTLAQNCGANVIRTITKLRAKHAEGAENVVFGIDGNKGEIADMKALGIWEPYEVKAQTLKTSIESAILLLRIDDIVSGLKEYTVSPFSSSLLAKTLLGMLFLFFCFCCSSSYYYSSLFSTPFLSPLSFLFFPCLY